VTSPKKKALGRGLDTLFPYTAKAAAPDASAADLSTSLKNIAIASIKNNPYQPRRSFDDEKLAEMSASIKERGVLQPILVKSMGQGFQLVAGERRLRAAKMAGLTQIPCLVIHATDEQCLELALIENLQRENLNPIEEAKGYEELIVKFGLTQEEAAARVGKERSTVANSLRLLKLPPTIIEDLEVGRLTSGHARALLTIDDRRQQAKLWAQIVEKDLSVRQTEAIARELKEKKSIAGKKKPPSRPADICEIEERMMGALGTRVQIRPASKTAGKIVISYSNLDDMDRILEILGITQGD